MESGSWTDHGSTGVSSSSSKAYNAIDGNVIDAGGTYYMNFGSFWHDIYQAPMNSAATKVSSSPYNLAYDPSGTHAVEGPYIYNYGDYYYLFYSAGICCGYDRSKPASGEEYKIKVCRSTSPTSGFVSLFSNHFSHSCSNHIWAPDLIGRHRRHFLHEWRWYSCTGESHGTVYGPGGQ
jgi:arabinan endo-1,5-alpha-L-arabinosidase